MKKIINIAAVAVWIIMILLLFIIIPDKDISKSERRKLKQLPKITATNFTEEFELYAKDQFPFREEIRTINSYTNKFIFGRKEINDLYAFDGYISKLEDGIHEKDLEWSANRIKFIMDNYGKGKRAILAVIPDKNYYIAKECGYPHIDYQVFVEKIRNSVNENIDLVELESYLSKESFYKTDTHWKQEEIVSAAEAILNKLKSNGYSFEESKIFFNEEEYRKDFYGVYYGQLALPMQPDTINYLTWNEINELEINCYDTGEALSIPLYDFEASQKNDSYDFFLTGSKALITIENPKVEDGELVIFRDSFGSSIAPLFAPAYYKVTLVDIRYISPSILDRFIDFENADILFLYSTAVLNNSVGQFIN